MFHRSIWWTHGFKKLIIKIIFIATQVLILPMESQKYIYQPQYLAINLFPEYIKVNWQELKEGTYCTISIRVNGGYKEWCIQWPWWWKAITTSSSSEKGRDGSPHRPVVAVNMFDQLFGHCYGCGHTERTQILSEWWPGRILGGWKVSYGEI